MFDKTLARSAIISNKIAYFAKECEGVALVLLIALCFPNLVWGGCVFGSSNLANLTSRNNIILGTMNATLFSYTQMAQTDVSKVSNFNIGHFLANAPYSVNPSNYLDFTSKGKMLSINWTTGTQMATKNGTIGTYTTLDSYISHQFVDSVHAALQELASNYSFSFGIFRPTQTRFNFPGLTMDLNSCLSLDTSCSAGSNFVWRLSTTLPYTSDFDDNRHMEFETFATAVEKRFESYYRQHATLGDNFVRVNMLDASRSLASPYCVIGFMEVYFLNGSYQQTNVDSATDISQFTKIVYNDGVTAQKEFSIYNMNQYTLIVNSSYAPTTSAQKSSTPSNTSTQSNCIASFTGTFASSSSSSISTTTTMVTTTATPTTTANATTTAIPPTIQQTWTASLASQSASSNTASTTVLATTGTELSSLTGSSNATLLTSDSNATVAPSTGPLLPSGSTAVSAILPSQTQSNTTTAMAASTNSSLLANQSSTPVTGTNSSTSNGSSGITGSSVNNGGTTYGVNTGNTSYNGGTTYGVHTGNTSYNGGTTYPPGMGTNISGGGTPRANGTGAISISDGGTTYDVDPFFRAQVPVITKIYNDEFLLRLKVGTMASLTTSKAFFAITIPAIIGILAIVAACIFCWLVDCSRRKEEVLIT